MKDFGEMTAEEREAYWERQAEFQAKKNNASDMLKGCVCRICVSDDKAEIYRMYYHGTLYLAQLLDLSLEQIEKEGGEEE